MEVEDGGHLASDRKAMENLICAIFNDRTIFRVLQDPARTVQVYEIVEDECTIRYYALLVDLLEIGSLERRLADDDFHLTLVPYGTVPSTDPAAAYRMSFHSLTAVILGYRQFDPKKKEAYPLPVQPELAITHT